MATPKTVTDGSSDLDEAVLNLFLRAGKAQVKMNYCTILFTAASNTPTVDSNYDSDGEIVSGDLAYAAGSDVQATLTGFTTKPLVIAMMTYENASTNCVGLQAIASSSVLAVVRFIDSSNAPVDPDGNVTFGLLVIGV